MSDTSKQPDALSPLPDAPELRQGEPDPPGLGDDVPCEKCGAVALDTGLECDECGHDNHEAVTGKPFGAAKERVS